MTDSPRGLDDLSGYTDRWSVPAGESVSFMVSSPAERVDAQLVRLLHGDDHPDGPGIVAIELAAEVNGSVPGGVKQTRAGSYVVGPALPQGDVRLGLWIWPTRLDGEAQTVACAIDDRGDGWALGLRDGAVELELAHDGASARLLRGPRLDERQWTRVELVVAPARRVAELAVQAGRGAGRVEHATARADLPDDGARAGAPLVLAARRLGGTAQEPEVGACFDGKLADPWLGSAAATPAEPWRAGEPVPEGTLLAWDLSDVTRPTVARDASGAERHGRVVNAPARVMTGPRWTGESVDPRAAPAQWSAIHFHREDLEDARWPAAAAWSVPDGTPSGVYALRLRAGGAEDHLPFVVRPRAGAPTSDVALLLPTFTYMAYANERLLTGAIVGDLAVGEAGDLRPHAADLLLERHPEWGLSIYDRHADGSGCCHSSRLRPIPNVRPGYRFWSTGGAERFAADLYVTHFLDHLGVDADVFCDEDLHRDGRALLDGYRVLLTGTHPEYWSAQMLDALQGWLAGGGRLMYLGGNGFYWVTSVDPERPHLIEVRRGVNGTRAWTSEPGESHHDTTLEPGGLWRYRGRDPNKLVGVGFASQSDSHERAAGYERLPDSRDPRVAFVFEGVGEDEAIGDFGLVNDGAAGYEIDRCEPSLGAPSDVLRLATSQGRHGGSYLLAVEDVEFTRTEVSGPTSELVRADMTWMSYPNGGAVFSVGSCNWCASLSHDGYDNNVARITANVLQRMRRGD